MIFVMCANVSLLEAPIPEAPMADVIQSAAQSGADDRFLSSARPAPWSLPHRIFFRLVFSYLVLYCAGSLRFVPGGSWLVQPYDNLRRAICPWVAIHVFGLTGQVTTYFVTGSGDTTLQYVESLCYLVIAIVSAIVWSIADRCRTSYRILHAWLRILIRYTLAFTMFGYGFAKIFPLQFRAPTFARLIERYGDFSPMGVLWQFMGASTSYIVFSGAMEALGGVLLLFRRTTTLGAMICCAVLANIVALNFCYDVPVKLYSSHLLLMAVFLLIPDLRRLLDLLIWNQATAAADLSVPRFRRRSLRIAVALFQLVCIGNVMYGNLAGSWKRYRETYINPPRQPLHGLYEVESFMRNGVEVPPLTTDGTRWSKLIVDGRSGLSVRLMDGSPVYLGTNYDVGSSTVTLTYSGGTGAFTWSRPDADHLLLSGSMAGAALTIQLRRVDTAKFLLNSRGFHWISEYPFNR
jgi:hypothetical protein